jgi:concanavalin A-like lectin/glucanase superfamily protein
MALVHSYDFEVDGSDSVGSAHLSSVGSATIGSGNGHVGNGYLASGSNGSGYHAGSVAGLTTALGSVSLWVRPTAVGNGGSISACFSIGLGTNQLTIGRTTDGANTIRCNSFAAGNANGSLTYANNTWTNIIATWNAGSAKYYINGSLGLTQSYSNVGALANARIAVGAILGDPSGLSNAFVASIDRVRIFDHELSSGEIATLAAGGEIGGGGFQAAWAAGCNQVIR